MINKWRSHLFGIEYKFYLRKAIFITDICGNRVELSKAGGAAIPATELFTFEIGATHYDLFKRGINVDLSAVNEYIRVKALKEERD